MEEQRWLRQAESDLGERPSSLATKHCEWACFQSQQAAEKALKAFLHSKGFRAILTHSVRDLVLDCPKRKDFSNLISQGKVLDSYYIATRYPNGLVGNEIPAEYYSPEDAEICISYVKKVYFYGSFARGDFNEARDIDLIIVGGFEGRMPERIRQVLDITSLPVEPPAHTEAEFEQMKGGNFLQEVLSTAGEL